MTDAAWSRSAAFALIEHIAGHLAALLPDDLVLAAAADQFVLVSTAGGVQKTVGTQALSIPEHFDVRSSEMLAHHFLADAQDLVVTHLHRPWPIAPDGRTLHAAATMTGRSVRLGFRNPEKPEELVVELPELTLPDGPGGSRVAG
jgi:hypothetical protein